MIGFQNIFFSQDNVNDFIQQYLSVPNIGLTENRAEILDQTSCVAKNYHGSVTDGVQMWLGTRASGLDPVSLVHFPNKNNLNEFTEVFFEVLIPGVGGIESICLNTVTNQLYFPLSYTNKIVVADASDISNYQIKTIILPDGILFNAAAPILTDNEFIYICDETYPVGHFMKITTDDFTLHSRQEWTGRKGAHAGAIDIVQGKAYFTNNGNACQLAIVNLADLSYTEVELNISGLTDDFALLTPENSGSNFIIAGAENRVGHSGGVLVDLQADPPEVYPVDMLPSFAVRYDDSTQRIISACLDGFIEVWTLEDLISSTISETLNPKKASSVYSFRGYNPNEIFIINDDGQQDLFCSFWQNNNGGSFAKFKLTPVSNSLMSKTEFIYRS
jgi:hypothetical protein